MTGSRRRLAVLVLLALVLAVALVPGGGPPLDALLSDVPALGPPEPCGGWLETREPDPRTRAAAPRSGRAPPRSA